MGQERLTSFDLPTGEACFARPNPPAPRKGCVDHHAAIDRRGARLVWVAYPDNRTVNVLRSLLDRETLVEGDTLDGGDVIPGFSCPVAELFVY